MRFWVVLAVLLAGPVAAAAESCTEPLRTVFARVAPSVVSIQSMKINKAKPHGRFETIAGSGVIIDKDGQILTNAHVVDGAASLSVGLDSRHRVTARIVGLDPVLDLALLRVETASPLPVARLGDSGEVRVGDEVVAIGNPIGLEQTMTRGIVSALNRLLPGISDEPMIQTDAPINPGNSGGPLLDQSGHVIGVNSQIETGGSNGNVGIGFAVPSNTVREVVPALTRGERIERAFLGVQTSPASTSNQSGAQVQSVVSGGPADRAGIRSGDVITHVDGKTVGEPSDVTQAISDNRPGEAVTIELQRNGSKVTVTATLGTRPASSTP